MKKAASENKKMDKRRRNKEDINFYDLGVEMVVPGNS